MTDNVGILEHCLFTVPDKKEGYTTDDNARALQVALRLEPTESKREELIVTYLKFILAAQTPKGFHNNLKADLTWEEDSGTGEWFGRAMEALGETSFSAPNSFKLVGAFVFDQLSPLIKKNFNLRTIAHLITALSYRIKFDNLSPRLYEELSSRKKLAKVKNVPLEQSANCHAVITSLAEELENSYKVNSDKSWQWFENILSYDNARLPLSLLSAYKETGKKSYLVIAEESLNFLIQKTYDSNKDCFSFPGYQGWFPKGGKKAIFGQQPIEAGSTTEACIQAYEITKKKFYLDSAKKALEWYSGRNILGLNLLDKESSGVKDGLESWGVNPNEGAESILSFATAYLAIKKTKL